MTAYTGQISSHVYFITGTLSKQIADSTVENQQTPKEGGGIKRKKATSLEVLIDGGVIKDGAVLRYMKVTHDCTNGLMHHASHRMSMPNFGNITKSCYWRCMHETCLVQLVWWLTNAHIALFDNSVKLGSVEYTRSESALSGKSISSV